VKDFNSYQRDLSSPVFEGGGPFAAVEAGQLRRPSIQNLHTNVYAGACAPPVRPLPDDADGGDH
jgi:hypothetical protein